MRSLPLNDTFQNVAKRVIWSEPSEQSLSDPVRFVAYATRTMKRGMAVGVSVPLGSAERTFATAIVAVAVNAFGQLDSPCQRGARRQGTRCDSLVDLAWQSVRSSELGGVDRPSTGPRIDATSTRTTKKEAHFNQPTKQRVLTPFIRHRFDSASPGRGESD